MSGGHGPPVDFPPIRVGRRPYLGEARPLLHVMPPITADNPARPVLELPLPQRSAESRPCYGCTAGADAGESAAGTPRNTVRTPSAASRCQRRTNRIML